MNRRISVLIRVFVEFISVEFTDGNPKKRKTEKNKLVYLCTYMNGLSPRFIYAAFCYVLLTSDIHKYIEIVLLNLSFVVFWKENWKSVRNFIGESAK